MYLDILCNDFLQQKEESENKEDNFLDIKLDYNYWKTLIYLCVTVFTTLVFTLGYYYIEVTIFYLFLECLEQK